MIDPRDVAILVVHGNGRYYDGWFARTYSWPKLQIERLRRHTPPGYTVMVFGNAIIPEHEAFLLSCGEVEFRSTKEPLMPVVKHVWPYRNWMIRQVHERFKYIVILDSDAFPVRDGWLERYLAGLSEETPVVAVQRLENGDTHSDRCFMAFTSEAWRLHHFDFTKIGAKDAGGAISQYLDEKGLEWRKLRRSNGWNPHPLMAGIYDDHIYHHAAGTRLPIFRMNEATRRGTSKSSEFLSEVELHQGLMDLLHSETDDFLDRLRGHAPPIEGEALRARGRRLIRQRPELLEVMA